MITINFPQFALKLFVILANCVIVPKHYPKLRKNKDTFSQLY